MLTSASIHEYRKKLADGNILFLLEFNSPGPIHPVFTGWPAPCRVIEEGNALRLLSIHRSANTWA